ncbi:hypothetical protein CYY_006032 [Polysphondylium violaceum]|uniref:Cytidyltransferase-like domain-containing protein n=1 Tax=Polysphondylium violaceum TaxID=133409 RepID=A0A8J4PRY9_9MYCE|nr:hypothetical protein CYY_006032 [Polysphondylium violaceum]
MEIVLIDHDQSIIDIDRNGNIIQQHIQRESNTCLHSSASSSPSRIVYICLLNAFKNYQKMDDIRDTLYDYYARIHGVLSSTDNGVFDVNVSILFPELYRSGQEQPQHGNSLFQCIKTMFDQLNARHGTQSTRVYSSTSFTELNQFIENQCNITTANIYFYNQTTIPSPPCTLNVFDLATMEKPFNHLFTGGFFDYLHCGHKAYLSLGSMFSKSLFFISILEPKQEQQQQCNNPSTKTTINSDIVGVVENRVDQYKDKGRYELMQDLDTRIKNVDLFLKTFNPFHEKLEIMTNSRCPQIQFCPMTYNSIVDSLLVSTDSLKSVDKINTIRRTNNLSPLSHFALPSLLSPITNEKISSTQIRQLLYQIKSNNTNNATV